jgi:hypothetical protein
MDGDLARLQDMFHAQKQALAMVGHGSESGLETSFEVTED